MRRVIFVAILALAGAWLWSAGDETQIERAEYNVNFYYPTRTARYLGKARGLNQCQDMARSYAISEEVADAMWYYDCCMIAHASSPAHRRAMAIREKPIALSLSPVFPSDRVAEIRRCSRDEGCAACPG